MNFLLVLPLSPFVLGRVAYDFWNNVPLVSSIARTDDKMHHRLKLPAKSVRHVWHPSAVPFPRNTSTQAAWGRLLHQPCSAGLTHQLRTGRAAGVCPPGHLELQQMFLGHLKDRQLTYLGWCVTVEEKSLHWWLSGIERCHCHGEDIKVRRT